jgi:feruloyl esterase
MIVFLVSAACPSAGSAQALNASACEKLPRLPLAEATITSAIMISADGTVPAHCKVSGRVDAEINFELSLPVAWNGKLYQEGGGGFVGSIPTARQGLVRGYAALGTDTGHHAAGADGSWALGRADRQANFGYRAVHAVTVVTKRIIEAAYGRPPRISYFEGYSNGGRQAAMEAQRYPEDYDGIIAGAPALDWSGLMIAFNWNEQALAIAPIRPEELKVIYKSVISQCDAADGLVDGLVDNPRACEFDLSKLACRGGDSSNCLTAAQIDAYRKIETGPRNSRGEPLFPGIPPGAEEGMAGWQRWISGSGGTNAVPLHYVFQDQFLKFFLFSNPQYSSLMFNFDADVPVVRATDPVFAAVDPDLRRFQARGGKLIMWHGWADPAISADRTVQYYNDVMRTLGSRENVHGFFRLFLAPGMYHGPGGPGLDRFDGLTALEQWVEHGVAPETIVASNDGTTGVKRTRPLCPYPTMARYVGSGDVNEAKNFVCRAPSGQTQLRTAR